MTTGTKRLIVSGLGLGCAIGLSYAMYMYVTPASLNTMGPTHEIDRAEVIETWFAPLQPLMLGTHALEASIADTDAERQAGLSGSPYLPIGVVKLFIFDQSAQWSFWMKDMRYPIDIIWLDDRKVVVHIEENVEPATYPASFTPSLPARYVIETNAGFARQAGIEIGTTASWGE